jgi:lipopolysaccharide/colanic/teichoic acid biosynthesis glycosyltransferase
MQIEIRPNISPPFQKWELYRMYFKRPIDFILSLIAIIVLSPALLVVAVLVKTKLGTPVIFKQKRPGLNEKIFTLYKFRTMTDERDENGELLPDKVRLTKFGKFLRSTSLDELPELFNILKGDMSIVGPRPLLKKYLPYYNEEEKLRHTVRPGLSGLAQVNGRNNLEWDKRLAFDVKYVCNVSLFMDIKIIYKTILKVLKREDITVKEEVVLEDLDRERGKQLENQKITI